MRANEHRARTIAMQLLAARQRQTPIVDWPDDARPGTFEEAYAAQFLQMEQLGAIGGWKVGASSPHTEPVCAPLPLNGIYEKEHWLPGKCGATRRVEVELAVVMAHDLPPSGVPYTAQGVWRAVKQLSVAIEIVESRFADPAQAGRLSTLADLASHGCLVYQGFDTGAVPASALAPTRFRLHVGVDRCLNGPSVNPAGDPLRLLAWLANVGSQPAGGIRRDQVIIMGACLSALPAEPGDTVHAIVDGIGELAFEF